MMKAVIDRFEGEYAILIVGEEEQRINVPRKRLPKQARESLWLQVEIRDGEICDITIDNQETERARQRIAEKLERLRRGEHRSK